MWRGRSITTATDESVQATERPDAAGLFRQGEARGGRRRPPRGRTRRVDTGVAAVERGETDLRRCTVRPGRRRSGVGWARAPVGLPPPTTARGGVTESGHAPDAEEGTSALPPSTRRSLLSADEFEALIAGRLGELAPQRPRGPRPRYPTAVQAVLAAAGISGAATAGSATGAEAVDRLLRGGLAAVVAAAASAAPAWAVVVVATGAAALGWSGGPLAAVSGGAALVLAVLVASRQRDAERLLKATSGALAATTLLRVPGGPFGATAALTGILATLIVLAVLQQGGPRWRRLGAVAAAGLVGVGVAAGILGALGGLRARHAFAQSSTQVQAALDAARAGDAPQAAQRARRASVDLQQARSALEAWWVRPGWAVPVVGAHLRAADRVASSAGPAVEAAAGAADALRLDALRPPGGRLDLDRLAAAEPGLRRLSIALHRAQGSSGAARSPWLAAPFQDRLTRYDSQLAEVTASTDRALLAVHTVPSLLGRDRPTRWFIAVANPAETRELGGFLGDYAILVADRGNLHLERSGTVDDIGTDQLGRNLTGLELPRRYRSQRPEVHWQNVTGDPDLPTVATVVRALWAQVAPGSPLDGVAYVDPHGLAALLRLTGPVAAPEPLGTLTADNAARLLLTDQYARFDANDVRKGALNRAAAAVFTAVSSAPLPSPNAIGDALGPAARGGHLAAASFSPDGQRLLDEIGAADRLPAADGSDLASLRTTNLVANKLDAHVDRSVRYRAVVEPGSGRVEATATIELRSDATPDLPAYVADNRRQLPKGTDLLEVGWYSGLGLTGIDVDGRAAAATSEQARGWWTHSTTVEVPPGRTTTVVVHLAGRLEATHPYRLVVAPQAAAQDDAYEIEVAGAQGWVAGPVGQPLLGRQSDLRVSLRHK